MERAHHSRRHPQTGPRLKTNLDTDLLKLIAIAAMLIDHIGGAFFPEVGVFRWIGRLAFPIFCYCLTVGLLYTHDVRKYLTRLGIFALVSQPFTSWPSTRSANSGPTSPTGTSSSPCS
ncbi:MAG: TraX family protein [Dysosmobacter welbionis]